MVATISGGTYDTVALAGSLPSGQGSIGAFVYDSVDDDYKATYTPPDVASDLQVTLTVTATANGNGTNAVDGTSDTASDTETFTVNFNAPDTAPARPATPTLDELTSSGMRASWLAPDDGGSPITQYNIRIRKASEPGQWTTTNAVTSPHTFTVLDASTEYVVQVRAVNGIGNSLWSPNARATTNSAANTPATGTPALTGTTIIGEMLTLALGTVADTNGLPSGTFPAGYTIVWESSPNNVDWTVLSGQTGETLTLAAVHEGLRIRGGLSFTDGGSSMEGPLYSAATGAVQAAAPTPAVSLWNDPRRWYAGELVDAALLNRELRDQSLAIQVHAHGPLPGSRTLVIDGLTCGDEAQPFGPGLPFSIPADAALGFRTVGYGNGALDCVAGDHGHGPNGEVRA